MNHEALMREAYDHINAGDLEAFGSMLDENMVEHEEAPGLPQDKEGVLQFFAMFRAAFSDLRLDVQDVAVADDKVWTRIRITGTNDGEFMGMPATGKSVDFQGMDIVRVNDAGKAVDAFLDTVTESLKRGDSITFTGFGKFSTANRAARMGVNPRNPGEKVHIPASTVPKFSAGSSLKSAVKGGGGGMSGGDMGGGGMGGGGEDGGGGGGGY